MKKIHWSITGRFGYSKFFDVNEIIGCNFEEPEHTFLMFLPNFLFHTPFHYLLRNNHFQLFNELVGQIADNIKEIIEFVDSDKFIEKIVEMFLFIFENVSVYSKGALELRYCYLSYDRGYFDDDYDDDEEFSEDDDIDVTNIKWEKKERITNGSKTNQNLILILKLLKRINFNIQKNAKFSENNFSVDSF